MTSFGWKHKVGGSVLKEASKVFEANAKGEEDEAIENGDVDWLTLAPKRKCLQLEDALVKSSRLKSEGVTLAEAERFWEAIGKWDEALHLTPNDEKLLEMKAQALISLGEVFPAVGAAEKAVGLNANWWMGHQTLGRALLGMGEVKSALKSFSRAYHLYPADMELRDEDLMWAAELVRRKIAVDSKQLTVANSAGGIKIVELHPEENNTNSHSRELVASCMMQQPCGDDSSKLVENTTCLPELRKLPANYVAMRN